MEIYAINIRDRMGVDRFDELLMYASQEKQDRIRRYLKKDDALRTLMGDLLTRYAISETRNFYFHELVFNTCSYGKPFLKYPAADCYFNVSHSGDWVVCAVDDGQIGIDIEKIAYINFDIAKRFFSAEEYQDLMVKKNESQLEYFFDLWTLKESYIKCMGQGLSIPLDSFTIVKQEDKIELKPQLNGRYLSFRQYVLDLEYRLSLCAEHNKFPTLIKQISSNDLYQKASANS